MDTPSTAAARSEEHALKLPSWLPPSLGDEVKWIYDNIECEFEERLITQLTSDERMKKVWLELYKRNRRRAAHFHHPARVSPATTTSKLPRAAYLRQKQDLAVTSFFQSAYHYANDLHYQSVLSQAQIEEMKAPYALAAADLMKLAKRVRSLSMKTTAEKLEQIAAQVEEGWLEPSEPFMDIWVTPRITRSHRSIESRYGTLGQVHNPENLRRYVVQLAKKSSTLFKHSLYGTIATVVNVVFELQGENAITGAQVREMVRDPQFSVLS